jgi:hypothetical protein
MSLFANPPCAARAMAVLVAVEFVPAEGAADALDGPDKGWICGNERGARPRCLEVARPAEALPHVIRGGLCPRGELPFGDVCYILVIPNHAELDAAGRSWSCRPGFRRSGAACLPDEDVGAGTSAGPAGEGRAAAVTIERMQRALAALGFDPGALDGVLGERTREALRAYQLRKGLPATGTTSEDLISTLDADFLHCAVWLPLAWSGANPPSGKCPF